MNLRSSTASYQWASLQCHSVSFLNSNLPFRYLCVYIVQDIDATNSHTQPGDIDSLASSQSTSVMEPLRS